jgi:hypothetical protein
MEESSISVRSIMRFLLDVLILCVFDLIIFRASPTTHSDQFWISAPTTVRRLGFIFVSGFWTFRQTDRPYPAYLDSFFHVFYGELYFYTDNVSIKHITITRPNIHIRYTYPTVWDIPRINKLKNIYRKQEKIDTQPDLFRPAELYAVWNGKVTLIREVSREHRGCSVFWIDAGSLRDDMFKDIHFPDENRMIEVLPDKTTHGKMVFVFFRDMHMKRVFPLRYYSEAVGAIGTFFGGDFAALEEFEQQFWYIHDTMLARGVFVGVDQELFTTYLVYANETWVQPNFETFGCNPWFATWSFWSNPEMCFHGHPRLRSSREFVSVS